MADVEQVATLAATKAVKWFEEEPGVISSTRLLAAGYYVLAAGFTICLCVYMLKGHPDGVVVGSAAAVISALTAGGSYIQGKRT